MVAHAKKRHTVSSRALLGEKPLYDLLLESDADTLKNVMRLCVCVCVCVTCVTCVDI